ncbi:alpha-1,2-mannosyltransferase [Spinactinospora alkalitolerans]|uniref:Alpha-1,2-mannosyltransferase n=1 Tax=Spinactinospora alkalitolerans TaxID=687207 RepID=A0A852TPI1_9ACTN|nr:glycosyltransferase 87 family protein [Spinactinospora alkalitolerans]NYE45381.1 alpha-1,2-mannosyltransferase [Spinactinospora alkalitolerans]
MLRTNRRDVAEDTGPFCRAVERRPLIALVVSSLVLTAAYWAWLLMVSPEWGQVDMRIYLDATALMLDGGELYEAEPPFNYPPFAAFLFVPLALLGATPSAVLWYIAKLMCLQLVVWWYLERRGTPLRSRMALTVAAAALFPVFMEPLSHEFSTGQVNLLLMWIVLVDLIRPQGARWRGVLTGIAAGIKVVPALFIVYLLVTRQFRAAAVATGTFLGTVALGFAVLPGTAWTYWSSVLWTTDRVHANPEIPLNQSIMGVIIRFAHTDDVRLVWFPIAAAFTLVVLAVAAGLHRRGSSLEALTLVGLAVPMATPHAWTHHWAWLLPAVLLLFSWGRGSAWRSLVAVLLFLLTVGRTYLAVNLLNGHDPWSHLGALELSGLEQLMAAPLVIFAVAMLVISATRLRGLPAPAGDEAGGNEEVAWTGR